jgi:protein glucosyltransferase
METSLPNLSFIVCVHDFINPTLDFNIPIFASSKDISKDTRKNIILIPDGNNLARWKHSITSIYYADKAYNWEEKDNEIFWRGQIKGKTRKKIIKLAEKHPFINAKHASKSEEGYIIPELQIKHKYLLSLDSYGPSLTGFLWKLASNSVVIKQDSTYIQWYYAAMKPWVHYVPIKSDLSNIEEVFAQITKQDKKVKKIAIKSNEFVYKNLTYEDMLVYIYHALKVYKIRCYS